MQHFLGHSNICCTVKQIINRNKEAGLKFWASSLRWNGVETKKHWSATEGKTHVSTGWLPRICNSHDTRRSRSALMSCSMCVGNMKWDELWGETHSVAPQGKFAGRKKSAARRRSRNNNNYLRDKRQIRLSSGSSGTMRGSVPKEEARESRISSWLGTAPPQNADIAHILRRKRTAGEIRRFEEGFCQKKAEKFPSARRERSSKNDVRGKRAKRWEDTTFIFVAC